MATPENEQPQENQANRGQNAKRFGKIGLLVGAVAGLLTGGGIPAVLQMALLGAGASALGGAVAGEKLNPMLDKVMGMLPGRKKPQQEAPSGEVEELIESRPQVYKMQDAPEQAAGKKQEAYRDVGAIDSSVLENARAATGASVRNAGQGMEANTKPVEPGRLPEEWASREGYKRPTHEGPAIRQ